MKRLLVTGAAGFIGSNMVNYLINNTSCEIVGVDNFDNGIKNKIFIENLADNNSRFSFLNENFTDTDLTSIDVVYHFAATPRVVYSVEEPFLTNQNNVTNTLKLLDNCVESKVGRFIFSSSSSVYGDVENFPTTEDEPKFPKSPYALQKLIIEEYCKLYSSLYGLDTVSLRYFNVFGPNQYADNAYATVICAWIKGFIKNEDIRLDGTGEQSRDFSYVEDVCQANYLVSINEENFHGDVFNVAQNSNTNLNDIMEMIKKHSKYNPKLVTKDFRPGDVFKTHASIKKLQKINFSPKFSVEKGIELTYKWYHSILSN